MIASSPSLEIMRPTELHNEEEYGPVSIKSTTVATVIVDNQKVLIVNESFDVSTNG